MEKSSFDFPNNATKLKSLYEKCKAKSFSKELARAEVRKYFIDAEYAREEGNQLFREDRYTEALEKYNKSLCFAPQGSEILALAYANRSIIFLKAGFFQFCLENIDLALENGYPDNLKPKLDERKKTCLEKMAKEEDSMVKYAPNEMKLSHPANPKIPFLIDSLKLVHDEKMGRGIATTKDLKAGDIISIEESFVKALDIDYFYTNCFHCTKKNFYNLMPSKYSIKVMFCSKECADEAWDRYFKYIYQFIDQNQKIFESSNFLISLVATFKVLTMFDDLDELKQIFDAINEGPRKTVFDVDISNEKEQFQAFLSLVVMKVNVQKTTNWDFNCLWTWHFLKQLESFKLLIKTPEQEDLFLELLSKICSINGTNMYPISNLMAQDRKKNMHLSDFDIIGYSTPIFQSLINHSCAPNAIRLFADGKDIIVAFRPIKAGEQIHYTYGPTHLVMDLEERTQFLMKRSFGKCHCKACEENYPTAEKAKSVKNVPQEFINLFFSVICDENFDEQTMKIAKKLFDLTKKLLNEHEKIYPTEIHLKCLYSYYYCIGILINKKPMSSTFKDKKTCDDAKKNDMLLRFLHAHLD